MKKAFTIAIFFIASTCIAQSVANIDPSKRPPIFSQLLANPDVESTIKYYLPKKVFIITVPFIISQTNVYKKDAPVPRKPLSTKTTVYIKSDVIIEGKMMPDPANSYNLNFKNLGRAGKSFDFVTGFDTDGKGTLLSFNSVNEPITSDLIKGTVGILTSTLNAVASVGAVFGFDGATSDTEIEVKEEQTVNQKVLVLLEGSKSEETVDVKLDYTSLAGTVAAPTVHVVFKKIEKASTQSVENITGNQIAAGIFYKTPAAFLVTASVLNNQFVSSHNIVNDIVYVPQCGDLSFIPIPISKGKRTLEVAFNATTGNLSKYALKKESSLKASLGEAKSSVDDLAGSLKALGNMDNNKQKDKTQQEIDQLKLENEKLDLLKKKQELEKPN